MSMSPEQAAVIKRAYEWLHRSQEFEECLSTEEIGPAEEDFNVAEEALRDALLALEQASGNLTVQSVRHGQRGGTDERVQRTDQ